MSIGAVPWPRGSVSFSTSMGNAVQPYWLGNASQRILWTAGSGVQGVVRWKRSFRDLHDVNSRTKVAGIVDWAYSTIY